MNKSFFIVIVFVMTLFAGCYTNKTRSRIYTPFDTLVTDEFFTYDKASYYNSIQSVSNKMLHDSDAFHLNIQASDSTYEIIQYSFNGGLGIYKYSYGITGRQGGEYFTENTVDSKRSRKGKIPAQIADSFLRNIDSATNENRFLVQHCLMYSASRCLVVMQKGELVFSVVYFDSAQIPDDYAFLKDYLKLVD